MFISLYSIGYIVIRLTCFRLLFLEALRAKGGVSKCIPIFSFYQSEMSALFIIKKKISSHIKEKTK